MRRWTRRSVFILMTFCLLSLLPVQAQQNLLQNPGFETDYGGRMGRGDFTFPAGWDGWFTESPKTEYWMNVPPTGYPHNGPFRRSGNTAQSIAKGGGSFTAAALQRVANIPAGAVVRGTAFVYLENNEGTNAQVRIGIGSNVGTNPNGAVTWSEWEKRLNGHHQISVEHVAAGGEVTLFIYATQTWANDPNAVYIDDAELLIVGQGEVADDSGDGGGETVVEAPRPSGVPFVSPQSGGDGGEITHTVRSGDTLASIAVAYGVKVDDILALNGLDKKSFLQLDQRLIIATPDPTRTESQTESTEDTSENTSEEEATPVVTEEAQVAEEVVATQAPPENVPPPSAGQDEDLFSVSLITQHSASVNIQRREGNTFSLTFIDNQFNVVQAMPEFIGDVISLDFWTQVWDTNPDVVVQDAILLVDSFKVKLSLSEAQFSPADDIVTYTAVIDSITHARGQEFDVSTIPDDTLSNPNLYFQPDETFFNAMSASAKLEDTEIGNGFLCSWLGC
jgi:LysM repeat protein